MNNIGLSIDRARSLLRAALDPSMTFNPQPIHLRIADHCSGKPDHFAVRELGDEIGFSRSHQNMVLRPRAKVHNVRHIGDRLADVETTIG
jgi:hypothetical protein